MKYSIYDRKLSDLALYLKDLYTRVTIESGQRLHGLTGSMKKNIQYKDFKYLLTLSYNFFIKSWFNIKKKMKFWWKNSVFVTEPFIFHLSLDAKMCTP